MKKSNKVIWLSTGVIFISIMLMLSTQSAYRITTHDASPTFYLNVIAPKKVEGNGKIVNKVIPLPPFNALNVEGDFDVTVNPGAQSSVALNGDENVLPYINSSANNYQLFVTTEPNVLLYQKDKTNLTITVPQVSEMRVGGTTSLQAKNINVDSLLIFLRGNSNANIQGDIKKPDVLVEGNSELHLNLADEDSVDITLAGNSKVSVTGSAKNLNITVKGNSSVDATHLNAENVIVTSVGNANIAVHAKNTLAINSIGSSNIKYIGNPNVSKHLVGNGSVESIADTVGENTRQQ